MRASRSLFTGTSLDDVLASFGPVLDGADGPTAALALAMTLESLPRVRLSDDDLRALAAAHDAGGDAVAAWVRAHVEVR